MKVRTRNNPGKDWRKTLDRDQVEIELSNGSKYRLNEENGSLYVNGERAFSITGLATNAILLTERK